MPTSFQANHRQRARFVVFLIDATGHGPIHVRDDHFAAPQQHFAGLVHAAVQSVRVAVTGSMVSPPLFESLELLGKGVALERIDAALAAIEA